MKAAVIDVEANGLIANSAITLDKQPPLLEFYGCLVEDDGTIINNLEFMCNPQMKLLPEVRKITGLNDEVLAEMPTFKEHLEELQDFMFEADAVVGHNLTYDKSIVDFELLKAGVKPSLFWPDILICTVEATEHFKGFRLSLMELHKYLFGSEFIGAHRAKADVTATVNCYIELLKRGVI